MRATTPDPGRFGRPGGCLPIHTQLGQESRSGRRGFVDDLVAGVAVVAHRARVDERRNTRLDHRRGDHLGRVDAAVAQGLLEGAGPAPVADTDTAQVDHGVDTVQAGRIELAAARIPEQFVAAGRGSPHDP